MIFIQLYNPVNQLSINLDCEIVADLNNLTEEEWLKLRDKGIGGSDCASIIGLSQYKSNITLFAEKTNKIPRPQGNKHTKFGKILEPVIREWFAEEYRLRENKDIVVQELPFMLHHKNFKFIRANLDGIVFLDEGVGGLEIKTASINQKKAWEDDEVPDAYYCQIQHYMAVTNLNFFIIVVLLDKELIWRTVPRNEDFINQLIESEVNFWENYVQKNICPEPDGHFNTTDTYNVMFNEENNNTLEKLEFKNHRDTYKNITQQIKELEKQKELIKQKFMNEMKDSNEMIVGAEKRKNAKGEEYEKAIKVTWKYQTRPIFENTKIGEKKIRVMRIN